MTARLNPPQAGRCLPRTGHPPRPGALSAASLWWLPIGLVVLISALDSGISGALVMLALCCFVVAVVALIRGRLPWAFLRGRPQAGGALAASATPRSSTTSPTQVYYANCTAVKAAGKAPLLRGQPGYRAGLDRDDDGVACEA